MGHTKNGFVWMEFLKNTEYRFINSYTIQYVDIHIVPTDMKERTMLFMFSRTPS